MKVRESGIPEADLWHTFFDTAAILNAMGLTGGIQDVVDFGCGYGTFAVPATKRIRGTLHGFDIDPAMITAGKRYAEEQNLHNVRFHLRDFVTDGTGLEASSMDYVMLFNILHAENPMNLLREARRILAPEGRVGVIHWKYDPETPRAPPMSMRLKPEDGRRLLEAAEFAIEKSYIDLPPYHYGILAQKKGGVMAPCGSTSSVMPPGLWGFSCCSLCTEGIVQHDHGNRITLRRTGHKAPTGPRHGARHRRNGLCRRTAGS